MQYVLFIDKRIVQLDIYDLDNFRLESELDLYTYNLWV